MIRSSRHHRVACVLGAGSGRGTLSPVAGMSQQFLSKYFKSSSDTSEKARDTKQAPLAKKGGAQDGRHSSSKCKSDRDQEEPRQVRQKSTHAENKVRFRVVQAAARWRGRPSFRLVDYADVDVICRAYSERTRPRLWRMVYRSRTIRDSCVISEVKAPRVLHDEHWYNRVTRRGLHLLPKQSPSRVPSHEPLSAAQHVSQHCLYRCES